MSKVLIVVTSYELKASRVYDGADEWRDGWRFSDRENYELRSKSMAAPVPIKNLADIAARIINDDTIVWIRTKTKTPFPVTEFVSLVNHLLQTSDVFVAYHDESVGNDLSLLDGSGVHLIHYTLSTAANKEGFKAIISRSVTGSNYLDPKADFDDIFDSFFLAPTDVFAFVIHKIVGTLSSIELDLQVFGAASQPNQEWSQLKEIYKDGLAGRKLAECRRVIYENPNSLKRLYERQQLELSTDRRAQLSKKWTRLNALLPPSDEVPANADSAYAEVKNIIEGLNDGTEAKVRKNFENGNLFRQWMDQLVEAIEGVKEVIMADHFESVGV